MSANGELTLEALLREAAAFARKESTHPEPKLYAVTDGKSQSSIAARRFRAETSAEFGDFQTPTGLANDVCRLLKHRRLNPSSLVEPTCGTGGFLFAALDNFPTLRRALALDINPAYIDSVGARLARHPASVRIDLIHDSFFSADWPHLLKGLPDPVLVIGNPPWITNAALSGMGSSNLPEKRNFQGQRGFDARTGKGNFDISEWMLIHLLKWLSGRDATLAMLCKTGTARKALAHDWKCARGPARADLYAIDAQFHFGAAVDASLLACQLRPGSVSYECGVHRSLNAESRSNLIGFRDGMLIADLKLYERWKHLAGRETYRWRSGIKHDCSRVLELRKEGERYCNGYGELIALEPAYLYPMLKSSEIAAGGAVSPESWMLVTQRSLGEDTSKIAACAPKTWQYLIAHAKQLDRRASSIYRGRPRFSVFGVGEYSFAPWKVCISGFYKKFRFAVVGPVDGKPVMLDDTSYFIGCDTEDEARYVVSLLESEPAQEFYRAFVFWDAKRPITVELLRRLDLISLAASLGSEETIRRYLSRQPILAESARAARG